MGAGGCEQTPESDGVGRQGQISVRCKISTGSVSIAIAEPPNARGGQYDFYSGIDFRGPVAKTWIEEENVAGITL
jgi:hypothetical protein